jgi:hypothetical protein
MIFCRMDSSDGKNMDLTKINPIAFNDEKRKRLGNAIHHSFLHPKPFKIGKLSLATPKEVKVEKKSLEQKPMKERKHKFNII